MRSQRKLTAAVLAVGALLVTPVVAGAVPWPQFGGDGGHSGNQPVNQADMPTRFVRELDDAGSLRTALLISGGTAAQRVISYGKFENVGSGSTDNDATRIHMRRVDSGAENVEGAQQVIDDSAGTGDDDVLGDGDEFVTPVDTSSADGPGQLFVLHNDDDSDAAEDDECLAASPASENDIAIAQFDVASGDQKKDFAIGAPLGGSDPLCDENPQVTDGYTLDSSPVITPPLDAGGTRYLFAVLRKDGGGAGRLLRVEIDNSGSPDAVIHATTPAVRDIANLNTKASPTIAYFTDPDRETVIPYVVVSINAAPGASDIKAFKVADISAAQRDLEVPSDIPGNPQTVSVPVSDDGSLPGEDNGGQAPALYAAYHDGKGTTDVADDETIVRKFVQEGQNEVLTMLGETEGVSAAELDGKPSPALAVTEVVSDGVLVEGRVLVTTSENVFALDSETLNVVDRLRDDGETPLSFVRNTPVHSGGFVFLQSDSGALYALDAEDGLERVPQNLFVEPDANNTSTSALGAPAYANGKLVFASNLGIWQYDTNVVLPPNQPPVPGFTITPNPARQGQTVTFDASTSSDPDGSIVRYEWDLDGNGVYETDRGGEKTLQTAAAQAGTFKVGLRVTDSAGATATLAKDLVVGANQPPVAVFTTTPSFGTVGERVNFDASASRDPDGSIAKYQWDMDGNGSFETDTGSNPKASRTYTSPGVVNVKLRVTDNEGASGEVVRQLSVTAASRKTPTLRASVTPKRDGKLPYRFRTKGRIGLPTGVSRSDGCRGRVTVTVKSGRRTVSRRTTGVRRDCRFGTRVTFRNRKRLGKRKALRFIVRFQGNNALRARQAKTIRRRIGR